MTAKLNKYLGENNKYFDHAFQNIKNI